MRFGSVCSGIEAASLAFEPLGWEPVFFSEMEPFPCAVLTHRWPDVPNLGDMTKIDGRQWRGKIDVLVGGTPCQAFSIAGLRQGLEDARGNLTLVFAELADAIKPSVVLWENVPGVLSDKTNAFGCLLGALAGEDDPLQPPGGKWTNAGFVLGPERAVAWIVKDAQYFRVAQRRRRVFVVACPRDGADPRAILFEREGVRRDTAPRREAGQGVAGATVGCIRANCGPKTHGHSGLTNQQAVEAGHVIPVAYTTKLHNTKSNQAGKFYEEYSPSLQHNSPAPAVCFDTTQITSPANYSNPRPGDPCHPLAAGAHPPAVVFDAYNQTCSDISFPLRVGLGNGTGDEIPKVMAFSNGGNGGVAEDLALTLDTCTGRTGMKIAHAMQVRRLTATECERLQGMPDGHTQIPWRGKPAEDCPDGPRYKAIGNSMAVPCMRWIGRRISEAHNRL